MNYREFRLAVFDEQDKVWDEYDGSTPDHIILSKELYDWLDDGGRFEKLKENYPPKRPGYLGMKVWWSLALDKKNKHALLVSNEVFQEIVTRTEDFK
jgi:hypothetical protein